MNKWSWRIAAIVMLLLFWVLFAHMQRQLRQLQEQQEQAAPQR